jgi:hypothetical protein
LVGYVAAGLVGLAALSSGLVASKADTGVTTSPTATPASASQSIPPGIGPASFAGIGGGGANNMVLVVNRQDQTLKVDGKVQINSIPGPDVAPLNLAEGYSSCSGCQTMAVALQIDLISPNTHLAVPKNAGLAINFHCTGCDTIGFAMQYVITVPDPDVVPDRVKDLAQAMNAKLQDLRVESATHTITLGQAITAANDVIAQFQDLAGNLKTSMQEETSPTTPGASAVPTVSGSPTESSTPAASPLTTPTATPSPSTSP